MSILSPDTKQTVRNNKAGFNCYAKVFNAVTCLKLLSSIKKPAKASVSPSLFAAGDVSQAKF